MNYGDNPPNQDIKTGIHYGVISQHAVPWVVEDIITYGIDLDYEAAVENEKAEIKLFLEDPETINLIKAIKVGEADIEHLEELCSKQFRPDNKISEIVDFLLEPDDLNLGIDSQIESIWYFIEDRFNDHYEGSDSTHYRWEEDTHILELDSSGDVWIIKSPYYTFCGECSPCAPNAGYLETRSSVKSSLKTYCLHPDDFEEEFPCPYPVWSIEDSELIYESKEN